jgi:predicted adenylyl cyclase CyaB
MKQNVELKARLSDLDKARTIAARLAHSPVQVLRQVDTYFVCATGRLKLRELNGATAELIAYDRPDETNARTSGYRILSLTDAAAAKELLAAALGVLVIVEKTRELYLHDNVRIHLDQVVGLGAFLEFEAVLTSPADAERGHRQVQELATAFALRDEDLVPGSYSDLLLAQQGG